MSCSNFISSPQFTILGCVIGIVISYQLDEDNLNILGNWFTFVAAIMLTIAAQRAVTSDQQDKQSQISYLKEQLQLLQQQVEKL